MIAEGDDAFGGKVVFEGIDQEICFEQNAIIEAGYIFISMMMSNEPADSFCLRGASPPSYLIIALIRLASINSLGVIFFMFLKPISYIAQR